MKITEEHIFDFNGEWKPANHSPNKEGFYITIRCGLSGIYTILNEWKNNDWQINVLDASTTIAYSRELIPKEDVDEWCEEKIKKYFDRKDAA